jgi:hypothetical protein
MQSLVQLQFSGYCSRCMCADTRVAHRQVAEMHLDERLEKSREVIGKQIAVGQQKVSSAYNRLWAEMEAMREAQRKRQEEARIQAEKEGRPVTDVQGGKCESAPPDQTAEKNTDELHQGNHKPQTSRTRKQIFQRQVLVPARTFLPGAHGQARRERGGALRKHRCPLHRLVQAQCQQI